MSIDMLPFLTPSNQRDGAEMDAVSIGNIDQTNTFRSKSSNFSDVVFGQLRSWVFAATSVVARSKSVIHVLLVGSDVQVPNVDAGIDVAGVENEQITWIFVSDDPDSSSCSGHDLIDLHSGAVCAEVDAFIGSRCRRRFQHLQHFAPSASSHVFDSTRPETNRTHLAATFSVAACTGGS